MARLVLSLCTRGSVKEFSQNGLQGLACVKSASNGGVLNSSLQVLHVHVLLVAPLSVGHMAQPGTDQHEGGVGVREAAHQMGTAADIPVEPFNDVIGTDASPVFAGKIAVGKRLLNAVIR